MDLLSDLDPSTVNNGILIVLGVLAVAVLRDRHRKDEIDHLAIGTLDGLAEVRVLHGDEVGDELAKARADTHRWYFRGGTGTYIRAKTLAECVAQARERQRELRVRLEILDPTVD